MANYLESYYGAMDPLYSAAMASSVWRNYYFGAPTPATKALQLPEIAKLGMSGIQNVEVGVLDPTHWEAIPKQHFEEMKRLAKLQLGKQAVLSVHAPIEPDPAGFAQNKWDEENRKFAETFYRDVIDKAQMLQNEQKMPVPVTIHATGQSAPPAFQWKWNAEKKILEKESLTIVNPISGEVGQIKQEERYYPDGRKVLYKVELAPEEKKAYAEDKPIKIGGREVYVADRLNEINRTTWNKQQEMLSNYWKEIQEAEERIAQAEFLRSQGRISEEEAKNIKLGWEGRKKFLADDFVSAIITIYDQIKKLDPQIAKFVDDKLATTPPKERVLCLYNEFLKLGVSRSEGGYGKETAPTFYMPMEELTKKKAAETFANLSFYSYDKYGEKGPQICVENYRPDMALGRSDSLRDALKQARELLVKRLIEEKKLSKAKAEEIANQKIGATWDIGHINILKRYGVPPEKTEKEFWEKHLKEEVEKIMKDIKHVHISDNFGYQDVHLPPGMGNVPIKEFLAALEKEGKLEKVKAILESGGFPAHLGIPPSHTEALIYFDAPLYPGISVPGPTWGELGRYFFGSTEITSGYGKFLPEGHFMEYGTGFSQLPYAFGGIRPGQAEQSRFSGTPMA